MTFAVVIGWDGTGGPLDQLETNGVRAVELGYPCFHEKSEAELNDMRRGYEAHGIRVWSVHAPFGKGHSLGALEESERIQAVETHKRLLPKAAMLGAEAVVIHPSVGLKDQERPIAAESLRRSLPTLAFAAEEAGLYLGLENMLPGHLCDRPDELMAFVEEVDSPALGTCFDTGHAHCNRTMRETFETIRDRIVTFHLQDNDGSRDMHLQPGYGTIRWDEFRAIFDTMTFPHPLVVEAAPWDGADVHTLLREMALLFEHADKLTPQRLSERMEGDN